MEATLNAMAHRDRTEALAVYTGSDARFSGKCCKNAEGPPVKASYGS